MKKQTEQKTEEKKNKPFMTFQAGTVRATIWENKQINKETGKEYKTYSVNFKRGYSKGIDSEGKTIWENTDSFNKKDLAAVYVLLQETMSFLYLNEKEEETAYLM